MLTRVISALLLAVGVAVPTASGAQAASEYTFSFPDAVHHVMHVDATFHEVPQGPFVVQMSRSSPGRYAAVEFVANVFKASFKDEQGKTLDATRPDPRSWSIAKHGRTIHAEYFVFGDQVDGTFLAIDLTHAHINLPAVFMWAHGFDDREVRLRFVLPPGSPWKAASQLYSTRDPLTFTAPNLQYLMDSPIELSAYAEQTFTVPSLVKGQKAGVFKVVAHEQEPAADLTGYVANLQKVVREEQAIFGEFPQYEPGAYTFLLDYLPYAVGDGMEHRNSTVITSGRTLLSQKWAVYPATHEFFHSWNVERIRPKSLEPFDFKDVNMSGEMWLAEGFTNYYARLVLLRTGLLDFDSGISQLGGQIASVLLSPGTQFRSAVDMSRLAPISDPEGSEPKYWDNTFVTYYAMGDMIALGLDLTLRERSGSKVTLDDFMRAMWVHYGRPAGPAPGLVAKPYTMNDVRTCLAEVSGDEAFANDFVSRYIEGTDHIDFDRLLLRAGLIYKSKGQDGTLGYFQLAKRDGSLRVIAPTLIGSPVYQAGLDLDDELVSVARKITVDPEDVDKALVSQKSGENVEIVYKRRGQEVKAIAKLGPPLRLEVVSIESTGRTLSKEQELFRNAWLRSRVSADVDHHQY